MTLDELMAEFPHGAHIRVGTDRCEAIVVGYHNEPSALVGRGTDLWRVVVVERVIRSDGTRSEWFPNSWEPEEVHRDAPCPITEPIVVWPWIDDVSGVMYLARNRRNPPLQSQGLPSITLHPAEVDLVGTGATEGQYGYYTWEQP